MKLIIKKIYFLIVALKRAIKQQYFLLLESNGLPNEGDVLLKKIGRLENERSLLIDERQAIYQLYNKRSIEYGLKSQTLPTIHNDLFRYPESWVNFNDVGSPAPYLKTYNFEGDFINLNHAKYASCKMGRMGNNACIDVGIDGFLQKGDALKLYELAYFCEGDILEIGTFKGLSTSILATGLHDAQGNGSILTNDINAESSKQAQQALKGLLGAERITFIVDDATIFMNSLRSKGKKFKFIFIDHWHGYRATTEAAEEAKYLLAPGGFLFFHDFNDPDNLDPNHVYGVYPAVLDTMAVDPSYIFYGNFGCCCLFRKESD